MYIVKSAAAAAAAGRATTTAPLPPTPTAPALGGSSSSSSFYWAETTRSRPCSDPPHITPRAGRWDRSPACPKPRNGSNRRGGANFGPLLPLLGTAGARGGRKRPKAVSSSGREASRPAGECLLGSGASGRAGGWRFWETSWRGEESWRDREKRGGEGGLGKRRVRRGGFMPKKNTRGCDVKIVGSPNCSVPFGTGRRLQVVKAWARRPPAPACVLERVFFFF